MASESKNLTNCYQIIVKGHLEPTWGSWFEGMEVQNLSNGEARLYGQVKD